MPAKFTIWVASHDEKQQDRFDMEDVRTMESFAGFAAGILRMLGYQPLSKAR